MTELGTCSNCGKPTDQNRTRISGTLNFLCSSCSHPIPSPGTYAVFGQCGNETGFRLFPDIIQAQKFADDQRALGHTVIIVKGLDL